MSSAAPSKAIAWAQRAPRATLNRITVSGTEPITPVVLRYHFFETLVCEPSCKLERATDAHNRIGFLRVPAPHPRSFSIRNAY